MPDVISPIRKLTTRAALIPVVVIDDVERAVPLAEVLQRAGINVIEITLRTAAAWPAARAIIRQCSDIVVGIGTTTRPEHLDQAAEIGAHFAVSPGFSAEMAASATHKDLPYLPGVTTTSEVMQAAQMGLDVLKFFPAERAGGVAMLQQFASLFPEVSFCPTGGIGPENLASYFELDNVCCVGGSWLTPRTLIAEGDWAAIEERASAALAMCL